MARSERERPTCWDKSLDLLSRREHFEAELRRKLVQRRYEREEIDATLERLHDRDFLDDSRVARRFVESRARRGYGRLRILSELRRKGAANEAVEAAFVEWDDEEELERARGQAERYALRRSGQDPDARRLALGRFLERRGYGSRVILRVLDSESSPP